MYVKVTNGVVEKYPYSTADLKSDNPNTSFPNDLDNEVLAELGVYPVVSTPEPTYDASKERLIWGSPVFIDGHWTHTWQKIPLSYEEQQNRKQGMENDVRGQRNHLLSESDWTQVLDTPVDRTAWAVYRQALRDVPSQAGFPWDVQWPIKPE